jgi:hypothetical protein
MQIRKPNIYDMAKAVKNFSPEETVQDAYLTSWIIRSRNDINFISYIAVEDKQVIGVITGQKDENNNISLGRFDTQDEDIAQELFNTLLKKDQPINIFCTSAALERMEKLGFKPISYNLCYKHNTQEKSDK